MIFHFTNNKETANDQHSFFDLYLQNRKTTGLFDFFTCSWDEIAFSHEAGERFFVFVSLWFSFLIFLEGTETTILTWPASVWFTLGNYRIIRPLYFYACVPFLSVCYNTHTHEACTKTYLWVAYSQPCKRSDKVKASITSAFHLLPGWIKRERYSWGLITVNLGMFVAGTHTGSGRKLMHLQTICNTDFGQS